MKIAVLLSGGVDSSVALRLLQEQGHTDLTAFYLKVWLEEELSFLGDCPWQEDLVLARAVCEQAGVDLEIVSLQQEYLDQVVGYTLEVPPPFVQKPAATPRPRLSPGTCSSSAA